MTSSPEPVPQPPVDTRPVPTDLERLSLGDIDLEYRRIASTERWAPTIVFLHEALGSTGLWRDFPDRLCNLTGCGAFIYSRQGHGYTTPLPRDDAGNVAPDAG